jgi:hypothetical protein
LQSIAGGVQVGKLDLDPENPRLPEEIQHREQHEILAYLEENDVLEELVESYISNGFFENEPILVLPPDDGGRRIVVEGNRRVGALMILLQLPAASVAGLSFDLAPTPPTEQLDQLRQVPAFEVTDRDEVSRYLGFRHISGLKTWDPESKARYLWEQVEKAAHKGSTDPFYEIGRRVGSNALGVRNAYNAYNILRYVRDRLGLREEAQYVLRNKFGVWTRLLSTANIQRFIGATRPGVSYADVSKRPEDIDPTRMAEVLSDLRPKEGRQRAVLQDSRDATDYSDVLANEIARQTLRQYENLELARQVVVNSQLGDRLSDLISAVEILMRNVPRMDGVTQDDASRADELARLARALAGVVSSQVEAKADT